MRNYVKTTLIGSSVYRTKQLNTRIGGSKTSSHMSGLAMDMQSHLYSPRKLARIVVHLELPFDQMIMERFPSKNQPGTWVEWLHIGIAPPGKKPRFETMVASGDRKGPNYERVSVI